MAVYKIANLCFFNHFNKQTNKTFMFINVIKNKYVDS